MNLLKRTGQWARHQWSAQGPMLLHSPYVFDFFNKVYRGGPSQHGKQVDGLRKKLTKSPTIITRQDLGAGGEQSIKLGQSVRNAGRRRVEGEWLYHLCRWAQPKRLLELGTHVGLSALYQSGGLEGDFSFLSLKEILPLLKLPGPISKNGNARSALSRETLLILSPVPNYPPIARTTC
ncbi:MAG: hypothetical protein AAFV07_08940 [Bacteroidota bacterium]